MTFYVKLIIAIYIISVSFVVLSGVYYCWFQFWYPSYKFDKEQKIWRKKQVEKQRLQEK